MSLDDAIGAGIDILEEALKGKFTPEQIEELQRRLMSSTDEVREATLAEVEEEQAYELDPVDMPPDFWVESDVQIQLGPGSKRRTLNIRFLNADDSDFLSEKIPDAWQYVNRKGRLSLEQTPLNEVIDILVSAAISDRVKGKPTKFQWIFYEALARCLTNPETNQIVTVGFLRSCSKIEKIQAVRRLWAVNHDFFIGLWLDLPGSTRNEISFLIGRIMRTGKQSSEMMNLLTRVLSPRGLSGSGTTRNGGMTNFSTRSPVSTGLRRRN